MAGKTLLEFNQKLKDKAPVANSPAAKSFYSNAKTLYDIVTNNYKMEIREIISHEKKYSNVVTIIAETPTKEKKRIEFQEELEVDLQKSFKSLFLGKKNSIPGTSKNFKPSVVGLDSNVEVYIILKDSTKQVAISKKGGFDVAVHPATIGITNDWYTPQQMAEMVKNYFSNVVIGKDNKNKDIKLPGPIVQQFHDIMDAALTTDLIIDYKVEQSKDMAFFAEAISAIKLGVLLQNPSSSSGKKIISYIKFDEETDYLNVLKKNKRKIWIKLPIEINYPLLDYYISYNGKKEEKTALKISVKSKLAMAKGEKEATGDTNTVKFSDLFDDLPVNVDNWYDTLKSMNLTELKKEQFGPKVIAYSSVNAKLLKTGSMYPIQALSELLKDTKTKDNQYKQIYPTLSRLGQKKPREDWNKIKKINGKGEYSPDDIANAYMNAFIEVGDNLKTKYRYQQPISDIKISAQDKLILEKTMAPILITNNVPENKVELKILNLIIIAEKIIAKSATKESKPRYNFYRMFFDKVIAEKSLIYSIPTRVGPDKLNIKFYAYNNWEEHYKGFKEDLDRLWIGLRGKASTNKTPDSWGGALGISV